MGMWIDYDEILVSGFAELRTGQEELFNTAAGRLRDQGYDVFNPAENVGGDTSRPRSFYMRIDIPALLNCDELVLLPGWRRSRGANLETWLALHLDMPVFEYRTVGDTVSLHPLQDSDPPTLPFDDHQTPVTEYPVEGE
jgi:hypothetical protein